MVSHWEISLPKHAPSSNPSMFTDKEKTLINIFKVSVKLQIKHVCQQCNTKHTARQEFWMLEIQYWT